VPGDEGGYLQAANSAEGVGGAKAGFVHTAYDTIEDLRRNLRDGYLLGCLGASTLVRGWRRRIRFRFVLCAFAGGVKLHPPPVGPVGDRRQQGRDAFAQRQSEFDQQSLLGFVQAQLFGDSFAKDLVLGGERNDLRVEIFASMWLQIGSAKIEGAIQAIQLPWISVELLGEHRHRFQVLGPGVAEKGPAPIRVNYSVKDSEPPKVPAPP
jgi:hypothetical protein